MTIMPRTLFAAIVFTLFLAIALGWLLADVPALATDMAKGRTMITTAIALLIVGPLWIAYRRLSVLDDIDSLDDRHRDLISAHATFSRNFLLRAMVGAVILGTLFFILLAAAEHVEAIMGALWVVAPIIVATFFMLFTTIILRLMLIESDRRLVADLKRKDVARKKLIEQLQKERKDNPLAADPHLKKYTSLVNGEQ